MSDFIIREPGSDNARGPFTLKELATLRDASQLSKETLYYVESTESWQPIIENEVIRQSLFPEKNKLTLRERKKAVEIEKDAKKRQKELARKLTERTIPSVDEILRDVDAAMPLSELESDRKALAERIAPEEEDAEGFRIYKDDEGVQLDSILAESEGNTQETSYLRRRRRSQEMAIALANPVLVITLLLSCFAFAFPSYDLIREALRDAAPQRLLDQPATLLALVDLILAICIGLAATEVFPLLRLRAMIGVGFFGIIFYSFNNIPLMIAAICLGVGLYTLTLGVRLFVAIAASALALAGAAVFAYAGYAGQLAFGTS